jgi:hypothetical protein
MPVGVGSLCGQLAIPDPVEVGQKIERVARAIIDRVAEDLDYAFAWRVAEAVFEGRLKHAALQGCLESVRKYRPANPAGYFRRAVYAAGFREQE